MARFSLGVVITIMIFGIVWQSSKVVVLRMLDSIEPHIIRDLKHAAEPAAEVKNVLAVRARYVGHKLQGEMTVAIDPSLTVAQIDLLVNKIKSHARHHVPALDHLVVETKSASDNPEERPESKPEHRH